MRRKSSCKVNRVLANMALAASAACSQRDATSEPSTAPTVTSISPSGAVAGGTAFTLTIIGSNFDSASTVHFGGTACATAFVSIRTLTAVIPAAAIASVGVVRVTVTKSGVEGASNVVTFTIIAADDAAFMPTIDMQNVSGIHTATLLPNGAVLVAGGSNGWTEDWDEAGQNDAELFDPAIGSFATTAKMAYGRSRATATLLPNGKVLLTGGEGSGVDAPPVLASAELYDPATSTYASAGTMANVRMAHTATLLPNGKVLIAGGGNDGGWGFPVFGDATASAELYDPSTNVFTPTGPMGIPRFAHTATLLPSGKVLIAGGFSSIRVNSGVATPLTSTEIYDPGTGKFTPGISMAGARGGHTATLLRDGTVLITGGFTTLGAGTYYPPNPGSSVVLSSAELRDPMTGVFLSAGKMTLDREEHTATLLNNGKVLLVGGATGSGGTLRSAELYDPATRTFVATATMSASRSGHSATLLRDGSVLIAGGHGVGGRWDTGDPGYVGFLHSAEIYHPH